MSIRDLFRRSTQMATATAIKSKKWQPIEYAELLAKVARTRGSLHPDTVRTIQAPLATIGDPLLRQACVDSVVKFGEIDKSALFNSLLLSGDLETAAVTLPPVSQLDADKLDALPKLYAETELCNAIGGGLQVEDRLWCQMFDWALRNNYETASKLWANRPRSAMPSQAAARAFAVLAGKHQDLKLLHNIAELYDLPMGRPMAAAVLNGLSNAPLSQVVAALEALDGVATVHDAEHAGAVLVQNIKQVLALSPVSQLVGNALLAGLYRSNTSQTVFHVYRHLQRDLGFVPNADTFKVLANAAYRVGNSKITSYHLWSEAKAAQALSRQLAETTLICQLIGPSFRTVFFYLNEMKQYNIYLRRHVQRRLYNKFSVVKDGALVALFSDLKTLSQHAEFDMTLALDESRPYEAQAQRNADVFLHGFKPTEPPAAVLDEMLAFDAAYLSSQSS